MKTISGVLAALLVSAAPAVGLGAGLPGGATTLHEGHDDWVLDCRSRTADGKSTVACSVSQQQVDKNTRKRVIAIVLDATDDGGAKGTMVMPFGLALAKGVTLQIDDGPLTPPLPFSTCMPGGCLVPINWPSAGVKALRKASELRVAAESQNGQPAKFTISLKGFSSALDRAIALTKG